MMNKTELLSWQEFLMQLFVSHWLLALLVVAIVATIIYFGKSLNATTRHNLWLIALVSLVSMPLLVFAPKLSIAQEFQKLVSKQQLIVMPRQQEPTRQSAPFDAAPPIGKTQRLTELPAKPAAQRETSNTNTQIERSVLSTTNDSGASVTPIRTKSPNPSSGATNSKQLVFSIAFKALGWLWVLGMIVMIRRLWGEYRAARELELQSDSITPYFERRFSQLCQRLKIKHRPVLRFHAGINAPMTVGLSNVWVAIPMMWRDHIDDDIFDQTLTHELGHIARRDPLVNTMQRLLGVVFWMYPAFWYVSRQLELERESACDDWVLCHDGQSHAYASNLLNVAETLYLQPHVLAVGCLRSHSQLSRRIQNLLNKTSDHALNNSWKLLGALSIGLLFTLSVSAFMWPNAAYLNVTAADLPKTHVAAIKTDDTQIQIQAVDSVENQAKKQAGNQMEIQASSQAESQAQTHAQSQAQQQAVPFEKEAVVTDAVSTAHTSAVLSSFSQSYNGRAELLALNTSVNNTDKEYANSRYVGPADELLLAIIQRDKTAIKQLIKSGETVDETAVTLAMSQGDREVVEWLLDAGAQADENSLIMAIQKQEYALAQRFLSAGAKPSSNALTLSISQDNHALVEQLMALGATPDDASLKMAIHNNDAKLVRTLLQKSADLDLEEALLIGVKSQHIGPISVLIAHGVEISDQAYQAAMHQHSGKIRSLVTSHFKGIPEQAEKGRGQNNKPHKKYKHIDQHKKDFGLSQWPISAARITLRYHDSVDQYTGDDTPHNALDFAAPLGTHVYAVAAGKVVESTYSEGYGNYVLIDHGNGYKTRYANNHINKVSKGQSVRANEEVAIVGASAKHVTGPHLHFEVKFHHQKLDPELLYSAAQ